MVVALGVGMAPLSASAAQLNSALVLGENTLQDTDGDRVLDAGGNVITSGAFAEGMTLEAVLRFDTINSQTPFAHFLAGRLPLGYDLAIYSQIKIDSLVPNDNGTPGDVTDDFFDVAYGPSGALGAGVMAAVYENTTVLDTIDFTTQTADQSISELLSSGNWDLIAEFGFGETDDFWTGALPLTVDELAGIGAGTGLPDNATGVFGLSLLSNDGGLPIAINGIKSDSTGTFHDLVGNASAKERSTGFTDTWIVETDTQVKFNVIPEPGMVLLLGAGLLGAGFARKRMQG